MATVDAERPSIAGVRACTLWQPQQPPSEIGPTDVAGHQGIPWFDLVSGAKQSETLLGHLQPACPGLTAEMLDQLLTPDDKPEGRSYLDGRIRLASSFSVESKRLEANSERGSADGAGVLVYQPVELLASDGWLVTCWHPTRTFAGAEKLAEGPPGRSESVLDGVARHWAGSSCRNAGDLGVVIMHELALSYAPAHRELYAWLEDWELSLYIEDDLLDPEALPQLWGAMAVLRDWLNPLNRPGLKRDLGKAWLPATDQSEIIDVDERVDKALSSLRTLGDTLRSSFSLLHVQLVEEEKDRRESMQHRVELLAAVFLVPTLVVGFYGANTWVPGQGRHWGFWVMIAALLLFTLTALIVVRSWQRAQNAARAEMAAERARLRADLRRTL